jgi:hypothetical protein
LDFPRAYLRLGEMYERGSGTAIYPKEALDAYKTATETGEIIGYAGMARLASRAKEDEKAEVLWRRFFEELAFAETHDLDFDEPAASIHAYLFSRLARSEQPTLFPIMKRYRSELAAYIQRYLENVSDERQLEDARDGQVVRREPVIDEGVAPQNSRHRSGRPATDRECYVAGSMGFTPKQEHPSIMRSGT